MRIVGVCFENFCILQTDAADGLKNTLSQVRIDLDLISDENSVAAVTVLLGEVKELLMII